jgi:hypothetical protein
MTEFGTIGRLRELPFLCPQQPPKSPRREAVSANALRARGSLQCLYGKAQALGRQARPTAGLSCWMRLATEHQQQHFRRLDALQPEGFRVLVANSSGARRSMRPLDSIAVNIRNSREVAKDKGSVVTRNRGHAIAGKCERRDEVRHRLPADFNALLAVVGDGDVSERGTGVKVSTNARADVVADLHTVVECE